MTTRLNIHTNFGAFLLNVSDDERACG